MHLAYLLGAINTCSLSCFISWSYVLYRNSISESFSFPVNCKISWKKENVIDAAKQKKYQEEEEEMVKKLIKMSTLLKSPSDISSAAEIADS
jgi:hypothetical protein